MKEKFIRNLDRSLFRDKITQSLKASLPDFIIKVIQKIHKPASVFKAKHILKKNIMRALPYPENKKFFELYCIARKRWNCREKRPTGNSIELLVPTSEMTVKLRPGTCDIILFYDILINKHYGMVEVKYPKTIIDIGANIGIASIFFLNKYKNAHVIAVECDPINYKICSENLTAYGDRVTILNNALWTQTCQLSLDTNTIGTWASNVSENLTNKDNILVEAIDMDTLIKNNNIDIIDILKVDIEGAEIPVFNAGNVNWLSKVKCLQIELENKESRDKVLPVLIRNGFEISQYREITIAKNRAKYE